MIPVAKVVIAIQRGRLEELGEVGFNPFYFLDVHVAFKVHAGRMRRLQ